MREKLSHDNVRKMCSGQRHGGQYGFRGMREGKNSRRQSKEMKGDWELFVYGLARL